MDAAYKNDRRRALGIGVVSWTPSRVATCINLVLCIAIVWTGWRFYDHAWLNTQPIGPILDKRPARHGPRELPVDMDRIASAHLFGEPPAEPDDEPKVQFVPETSLDLALAGVVSFGAATGSQAIVKAGSEKPQAYSIGDSLPGNATIHQISARYIVIRRGTVFETVWLARDKPTDRAEQMIAVDPQPRIAGSGPAEQADSGPIALAVQEQKAVREARHAVFDEQAPVSRFARLQAIHREGQLVGYRVYPGRNVALFDALKLERGDMIVAVNDIALSQDDVPADKLTSALAAGDTLQLRIERNGRRQSLAYDLSP